MNLGFVSMAALAIAALPPGCGDVFNASVQVDDLCKTLDPQEFPAAPAEVAGASRLTRDFAVPVDEVVETLDAAGTSSLKLKSITLAPISGIEDLSFAERVSIAVKSGDQSTQLTQYQRAAVAGVLPSLTLEIADVDVRSFASDGSVTLSADVAGALPTVPWTVQVTACFSAAASL